MQRGELFSQPFIMIFALIIMALVLVFGIRSFTQVSDTADSVDAAKFILQLKNEITKYYNFDIGSSKILKISLPTKLKEICFYNPAQAITADLDPYVKGVIEKGRNNLYLLPLETYPTSSYPIEHLRNIDKKNPSCIQKKEGSITIYLETQADSKDAYVGVKRA